MSVNLVFQLWEGMKKFYFMVENVGFVKCFFKGVVEKNFYCKLVGNFYFVYSVMEEEMVKFKDYFIFSYIYFFEFNCK